MRTACLYRNFKFSTSDANLCIVYPSQELARKKQAESSTREVCVSVYQPYKSLKVLCIWVIALQLVCFAEEKDAKTESPVKFPLPNPSSIGAQKFSALLNAFLSQGGYENWKKDKAPRATGPFFVRDSGLIESFGTHGSSAVQVVYSPEVWTWMENGRKGVIPDGAMIIKLLYARDMKDPAKFSADVTGVSVMVKDSKGSWDGWFYSDGGPLTTPAREHAAGFFDPNAGFAMSCINCHATADNPEGTYSSMKNVLGAPSFEHKTEISAEGLKKNLKAAADIHAPQNLAPATFRREWQKTAPHWSALNKGGALGEPTPLPFSSFDHVPQGPRPDGHKSFVTASNCSACHDATQLYSAQPNMALAAKNADGKESLVNVSPHGEWRYSMMGLSGRDPIFYAQLESERALRPDLADEIDNACLSCHAPMAQRQWKKDKGSAEPFSHKTVLAEANTSHAAYGALARDGVSCVICHQMQPEGLGSPKQYSGKFLLPEKPKEVFGPYEKVATLPMEQAMGLTPKLGTHLSDSKLCASCHTVVLPSLDAGKRYSNEEFKNLLSNSGHGTAFHEQTTYLEWKNSAYSTEGSAKKESQRSCQSCHMPQTYDGKQIVTKTANIEDDTFPPVDHRAPDAQLKMTLRDTFSRHSLNGINIFALEIFDQNPWALGVSQRNNLLPDPKAKSGFEVAKESALRLAQEQTARVEILSAKRENGKLVAAVRVTNLAGHKFPSGVAFRRAFIEFKVSNGEKTLWTSGATDEWGVIVAPGEKGVAPLKTEFFAGNAFQPHYEKITRPDQVQIYEELVADSAGAITTSFFSLKNVLKDNRLLPKGWDGAGENADLLKPAGVGEDKDYSSGEGSDTVTYEIPIEGAGKLDVSATLYYQSLPPYYLRQRFEYLGRPATDRLFYFVNQLDLEKSPARDWKLRIAGDRRAAE